MGEQTCTSSSGLTDLVTIYELPYTVVKEAVFQMYLWGLRTDNDDAIDLYKQLLDHLRAWDEKFISPEYKNSRDSGAS